LLEQFLDPIIYLLAGAAILSFAFQEWEEGIAIAVVILLTVMIGFIMEWQAVRSMEALRQLSQTRCRVLREGREQTIAADKLVPGDILLLEMGEAIPADARLLDHENLAVKESALTGESTQVPKETKPLPEDTPLAERINMVFNGTLVSRGTAKALVVATGEQSQLGQISQMTRDAESTATPLEKKLNRLSRRLIWLTFFLTLLIIGAGFLEGKDLMLMIKTAIALAVAAIPEGLPIVATIALARGMLRLSRKEVVVKSLQAVQTLGETSLICTDKTGTLTENTMEVQEILLNGQRIGVKKAASNPEITDLAVWDDLIRVGILCNDARQAEEGWVGDPIEVSLLQWAESLGLSPEEFRSQQAEVYEIPFDTESKMMATLNETAEGYVVCVKGALEALLERCRSEWWEGETRPLEKEGIHWKEKADQMAADGLRTLAFAHRQVSREPEKENMIEDLTLLGLIGFLDPPRKDIHHAMETCREAGIRVVMVTGDHPETARNIAREIKLIPEEAGGETVITGPELARLVKSEKTEDKEHIKQAYVFARVSPAQKLDLVDIFQQDDRIVGMTGDGVNDAPALKKADIGIAMGVRGTEAAKEVADVVLGDDSFSSIELAIRQGRIIFENIRKFVVYLLSSNLAEILAVTIASLSTLPLPLLPLQILYLNLVTDVFPSLALGMGEGSEGIMKKPPRPIDAPILSRKLWISTALFGLVLAAGVIAITLYAHLVWQLPNAQVNNLAFYTLVVAQLIHVFNIPDRSESFFLNEVTRNLWVWGAILLCLILTGLGYLIPVLRQTLGLVPVDWQYLLWVPVFALGATLVIQILKRLNLAV
jgi:Ca2+-transporting ATPase